MKPDDFKPAGIGARNFAGAMSRHLAWFCSILAVLPAPAVWAAASPAPDEAAWETVRIRQERELVLDTLLVSRGQALATIVPAPGEPWSGVARKLQEAIAAKTGVTLPILEAARITDVEWAAGHLIVLGNLLNNPVFARLYGNYFACADAAYTGAGGYELRTVHDPWGLSRNAVVLGAQDAAGLEAGAARLLERVNEAACQGELKLGRLLDLRLTSEGRRAPLEEKLTAKGIADRRNAIAATYAQPGTERGAAHQTIRFAMLYHRTGDPGWLELYRYAMRRHMEYCATNEYIREAGPRRYDRDFRDSWAYGMVIAWDLVEEAPGWNGAERLQFTNHALRMVWETNLYQHWDRPSAVASWRRFDSITHNHHTWPGLANLFGGWYFSRHYKLPVARDWLEIALGMFRSCSRSWKPWEDSAGYQWIPQRHLLMYALASGDRTYIEQGHAAQTGTALLQALDSLGRQPGWGDCGGFTSVSGMTELLSGLEYATGDGRYRWARDWLGMDARDEMEAPYWTGTAAKRPDDLAGVAVSYLPRMHYDLFGRLSRPDVWQEPNLRYEDTFDKLTLRSGWEADGEYLMLDGTAAGSHGHLDANCIVAFTGAGAQWLVDAEYIRRIPKYHCGLTVLRDGVSAIMPPSVRLDHAVWFGQGALTRTTMPHYNGATWTRNIVFVPGRYTAVIDEVTAEQPGDFSLRCCWRVAGECALEDGALTARQREKGFTLRNLSGQRQELVFMKDFGPLPIHHLNQRQSGLLKAGETVRFVNVFAASKEGPPVLQAALAGEAGGTITLAGRTERFGVGGLTGPAATDAAVYRITGEEAWLAGATKFAGCLDAVSPVSARMDARGMALAKPQPVPVSGLCPVLAVGDPEPLPRRPDFAAALRQSTPSRAPDPGPAGRNLAAAPTPPLEILWRFADFPVTPRPLNVAAIRSDPAPREAYRPLERLIDGASNGSTTSCLFPPGKPAAVTLDLGSARRVREVQARAWERNAGWKTKRLALELSNDGFRQDIRSAGDLAQVGTLEFGANVNTLRSVAPEQQARYLRIRGEPVDAASAVYLAEIVVLGEAPGEKPRLVALAAADLDGDGRDDAVVGTAGGDLIGIHSSGRKLWRTKVDGPVTALAAGKLGPGAKPAVIYATSHATLGVLGSDGGKAHEVKPPVYRGVPSCVRTITLADLDSDGTREIVVGCDSWQYMAYSPELSLVWKTVYYAHGATVGHAADLDGDGKPEIVAGNAYYSLQILNRAGKIVARSSGAFGPEQTAVASGALRDNAPRAVVMGTDGGEVIAFDARGGRLWEANAGDRITALLCDGAGGGARVIAASESGYVWALDGAGKPVWKRSLGEPVRKVVRSGDAYFCAASAAGLVRLSLGGVVEAVASPAGPVTDLVSCGDQVLALTADGVALCVRNR